MAAAQDRQRRWRRQILIVGLLAAAGAFSLWFRAVNGHFPWSAQRQHEQETARGPSVPPTLNEAPAPPPDSQSPLVNPAPEPPPATQPFLPPPPATQPDTPTTLPAYKAPPAPNPAQAAAALKAAQEALTKDELVYARDLLGRAYLAGLPSAEAPQAIEKLAAVTRQTLFSPRPYRNDPLCEFVVVQPGDTLAKIANRFTVTEDLLAGVNNIKDKNLVRLGQRLKVMHGPWHAVVHKGQHLLDAYLQDKYVCTLRVGLGLAGSTPTGLWKVVNHQADPGWTDPRTGHQWHPSDPANPIGDYWIGLEGIDGEALGQYGFGIHGTIEPDSIGKDVSMGCIRLAPDDIALLFQLLEPGHSFVAIVE